MKRKGNISTMIVMSDMQIPYHDGRALKAVEKFMAAHRWDIWLNIGDFLDMESIASFNKGKPGNTEGMRLWSDYDIANDILDRHQKIVRANNKNARFVYLEGNHEERIERFFAENPMLKGSPLDVPQALKLEKRGIEWVRSWSEGEVFTYGKANFTHGQYTNKYHAAKMADNFGDSIFYGHTHDIMAYPKANKLHKDKVHVGQSLGCLCIRELSYMKGRPANWEQGFGVFYFMPDETFTYYVPRIFNGRFVGPDGVLYDGN